MKTFAGGVNAPRRGQRGVPDAPWGDMGECPQRGQRARPSGRPLFFERPPRKEKGGAINQPERARKRSDKTPDDRVIVNSRKVCGRMGTRFRRREGKGVDGCVVCASFGTSGEKGIRGGCLLSSARQVCSVRCQTSRTVSDPQRPPRFVGWPSWFNTSAIRRKDICSDVLR